MTAILNHLAFASIMAGILVLILCVLRRYGRKRLGSRMVYAAWLLVALRLVVPVSLPIAVEAAPVFDRPLHAIFEQQPYTAPTGRTKTVSSVEPAQSPTPLSDSAASFSPMPWLMGLWLLGVAVSGGTMLVQHLSFRRRLHMLPPLHDDQVVADALSAQLQTQLPPVYRSPDVRTPCLVGAIRPMILLPQSGMDEAGMPYALLHEACHARAHDTRWALLRNVLCCVFWFHPLVWLAAHLSRIDAELACDERVTSHMQASQRFGYAQSLVRAACARHTPSPYSVAFSGEKLKERIQFIVEVHPVKKWMTTLATVMMLAVLVISFATAQSPAEKETTFVPFEASEVSQADMDSFVNQLNALVAEKGPMNAWSLADKALLSDLMENAGVSQPNEPRYTLPGADDKTQDEVTQIAVDALSTQYSVDAQSLLSGYEKDYYFSVYPGYADDPFWQVDFRLPAQQNPDNVVEYSVTYKPRVDEVVDVVWYPGETHPNRGAREEALAALEAEKGARFETWPLEEMAAFDRQWYGEDALYICGVPGLEDVQEADALRLAKDAMMRTFGFTDGDMQKYDVWRMYLTGDPALDDANWIITYVTKGENPGPDEQFSEAYTVFLHGRTGDVMDVYNQAEGSSG